MGYNLTSTKDSIYLTNRKVMDKLWFDKARKQSKEKQISLKKILYENGARWE
jgi:hypothetical protein